MDDKDIKGLRFEEGEIGKYHYSNYGYQILARIISEKSKMPFTSYVGEHIINASGAEGSPTRLGPEPTPHLCIMGKRQANVGPAESIEVPDADGNGCRWMTAGNLEKIARAFAKSRILFENTETLEKLKTPIRTKDDGGLTVGDGPGLLLAPDEKRPAIVFQGTYEGRSAVALVIKGGDQPLSVAGVFNCIDSSNLWADLVEIYRGKTVHGPLEKFSHSPIELRRLKNYLHFS